MKRSKKSPGSNSSNPATADLSQLVARCISLVDSGNPQDAVSAYREWLARMRKKSPFAYAVLFNLGVLLSNLGDIAGACEAYREALQLVPSFPNARINLGALLEAEKKYDEAIAEWQQALKVLDATKDCDPELLRHTLNNLGRLFEDLGRFSEAEVMLGRSLAIVPDQDHVLYHWVRVRQRQCKWPLYQPLPGIPAERMIECTSPVAMLSNTDDPELQLRSTYKFNEMHGIRKQAIHLAPAEGYAHNRLRIGYLSSNLGMHAVSILMAELFELHDRSKFEVFAFDWSPEDGTAMRNRVLAAIEHVVRIEHMTDEQAAQTIRNAEIDILIDLQGLTTGARPQILTYRPAPVQIAYLGHPGPSGVPEVDYIIADRYVLPEEIQPYFTEKPLYMPDCFQVNDRKRTLPPPATRAEQALPDDAFVFCAFNNNAKFTPEIFATWMRILQRTPGSILWLLADNDATRANLTEYAAGMGIDKNRLIFAPRATYSAYLQRFLLADLFLDITPFNGGTTASDALWVGLPLVTCSGRSFASRMAGSLLNSIGLPELVSTSLSDYENLSVDLATHPDKLKSIRQQLITNKDTKPLFDTPKFVNDYEKLLASVAIVRTNEAAEHVPIITDDAEHAPQHPQATPLFSIIIATHNRPHLLGRAIDSILSQTLDSTEIIVVSDVNDQATYQVASERLRPQDIFIQRSGPTGPGRSRNLGLDIAKGKYVVFLDDDDTFRPDYLKTAFVYLNRLDETISFCDVEVIHEKHENGLYETINTELVGLDNITVDIIQTKNFIPNNCLIYPSKLIKTIRYDEQFVLFEDWDFLIAVLDTSSLTYLPILGPQVHKVDRTLGANRGSINDHKLLETVLQIYRKHPGKSLNNKYSRQNYLKSINIDISLSQL